MTGLHQVRELARSRHGGQVDKMGRAYVDAHLLPIAEAAAMFGLDAEVAGWLHDIVEDTAITVDDLAELGLPQQVVAAVDSVTKRDEEYEALIGRACADPLGRYIKLVDNAWNITCNPDLAAADPARAERMLRDKYRPARAQLLAACGLDESSHEMRAMQTVLDRHRRRLATWTRIDLHAHSNLSDGTDSPTELVARAKAEWLDVVALTDHDTVAGWEEAVAAGEELGITVVRGIELSTTNDGHGQHLLAYLLDPEQPRIAEILRRAATSRQDRAEKLFDRLDELGLPVDREYVRNQAEGGIPSRAHMALGMMEAGHVANGDEAFANYLYEGGPAYVARYRPTIEEAIAAIHEAGGVAVIAHPRAGGRDADVSDDRLRELAAAGLDGIEVDHQMHDAATRAGLERIARELGLAVTGSSDFHGRNKEHHELGCHLTDEAEAKNLLGPAFQGR